MRILGISAFYHDSAAALVVDGKIVCAAQEERFTRKKHDPSFPGNAVRFCLAAGGTTIREIDYVCFYEKPFLKFERLLETHMAFSPRGFSSFRKSMPLWLRGKLFQRRVLDSALEQIDPAWDPGKLVFTEHHESHAASAFFPSPFERAAVLTMDAVGEWATTSTGHGEGNRLTLDKEIRFPHSLGLLYSAFTYYTGFKVNSGEYKVMGLAPYGRPEFANTILNEILDLKDDGSFSLDQTYFDYCVGLRMTSDRFHSLFGGPPRNPEEPITQRHMNLAASVQAVTEQAILRITRSLLAESDSPNLCMAGGVALNCVANGKILRDGKARNIWVQPAAGDAGGAIGAALAAYYRLTSNGRQADGIRDGMRGSHLGPEFSQSRIESELTEAGAVLEVLTTDEELLQHTVDALVSGKAVGWFQGAMEFGPRALGARSILADPRGIDVQRTLNLRVKFRESFRPFAPAVLREDLSDWFDLNTDSPYMLLVADMLPSRRLPILPGQDKLEGINKLNVARSEIPAVTHVDYSARLQTVDGVDNKLFHALLKEFKRATGCPMLVNTSFNVRGEPIVCTPSDAFRCFMGTDIEFLAIGKCILRKENQRPELAVDYKSKFDLD